MNLSQASSILRYVLVEGKQLRANSTHLKVEGARGVHPKPGRYADARGVQVDEDVAGGLRDAVLAHDTFQGFLVLVKQRQLISLLKEIAAVPDQLDVNIAPLRIDVHPAQRAVERARLGVAAARGKLAHAAQVFVNG